MKTTPRKCGTQFRIRGRALDVSVFVKGCVGHLPDADAGRRLLVRRSADLQVGYFASTAHPGVADREHRFRKQRSSARQNASPTSIVHCHGAQTRLGLRGGGRLRVLSTVALAPPSIVCSTGPPGQPRPRTWRLPSGHSGWRGRLAEADHREQRDVLFYPERIERREIRVVGAQP